MRYIDVRWIHECSKYPIRLVSELDGEGHEVRKLEFFANGVVGTAGCTVAKNGTRLGELPLPALEEINADPQFCGVTMEQAEFDELWSHHAHSGA